ncbi:putative transcriptional regulator [Bradyrhizobium japonicum]
MVLRLNVSEWLGKKKMTQKQLAEATGIRPATISAMYHETIKRIELEQIEALCSVFECEPGDLFTYEKEQKKR